MPQARGRLIDVLTCLECDYLSPIAAATYPAGTVPTCMSCGGTDVVRVAPEQHLGWERTKALLLRDDAFVLALGERLQAIGGVR